MVQITESTESLTDLSDAQLLTNVKTLAAAEQRATARLIAALGEVERRKLFLAEGCASMFTYCTQVLHLSESAAYNRIEVARVAARFPVVLERLADGVVTLTTVRLLSPVLTAENHDALLAAARHKGKREVEQMLVAIRPHSDVASVVRKLPTARLERTTTSPIVHSPDESRTLAVSPRIEPAATAPIRPPKLPRSHRSEMKPLAPERYKIQFTASRETYDKLRKAQTLLRHAVPNGDPAEIVDRALTMLLAHLEKTKLASTERPRVSKIPQARSRRIPAAVRREVWQHDDGRCAFVGSCGRCTERDFLEFHHVVPYAAGGEATASNIELRCRAHNGYEAEEYFGPLLARERPPQERTRSGTSS